MTTKSHGVIRSRLDLLYDPKVPGDLCGRFDLFNEPKGHRVNRGRLELLYDHFMTPKATVTFVVGLT